MAITANHFMSTILTLVLLITVSLDFTVAQIGVAYGREGNGLPSPPQVVALYKQYGIRRMRIYDTDPQTLEALRGSDIEVTVGILNMDLQRVRDNANGWVQDNIKKYTPGVRFRHIVVGNEVSPIRNAEYVPFLLPTMQNVHNALVANGLGGIKVTTNMETEVLDPSKNFPPENGVFRPELRSFLDPIIRFLANTDAPLFASIYPYFAYLNSQGMDARYALLDPTFPGIDTPGGRYQNLFYALLDTMNAAVEKSIRSSVMLSAAGDTRPPEVKGGETGHPTRPGGPPRRALLANDANNFASVDNARMYINNLIQAVKRGTPKRPNQPIETYIFAMFDEDRKPGSEEERHFGLFTSNGQPKYPVNFN